MNFEYIHNKKVHTDTARQYMVNIGMGIDAIESVLQQKEYEAAQSAGLRQQAYKRESDPLYIEWQYELEMENSEASSHKQAWLDSVAAIKQRYPLPL